MQIIRFNVDTKHRKQWFTGLSFSHPAKMTLPLQLWLIENFTKEGETILDPMAGSGTVLVACSLGRHVIAVDLEQKFVDMMAGYDCDGQVKGYEDVEISSAQESGWILDIIDDPWMASPFATREDALAFKNAEWADAEKWEIYYQEAEPAVFEKQPVPSRCGKRGEHNPHRVIGNWEKIQERGCQMGYSMGQATILQGDARNLMGMLVDAVITSPPYSGSRLSGDSEETKAKNEAIWGRQFGGSYNMRQGYNPENRDNIGNLPYGSIDAVISSPPYEGSLDAHHGHSEKDRQKEFAKLRAMGYKINPDSADNKVLGADYSESQENIGNLKSISYLEAMLQVYQQCYAVLRPGGLMILVTKNFIRNKQQVRLDLDTIRLCEQAGFTFQDRWYRELASQSFWRTIYHQRYPSVPPIKYEDILIFLKG